jgi:fluoride exporter
MAILLVALGGALGAVLRYVSVTAVQRVTGDPLPWGTLAVNVAGSFALGFLMLAIDRMQLSEEVRRFGAIGLLGGFTTFSAFSWEVAWLLREGSWGRAAAYAIGSVVVGVTALIAGGAAASVLLRSPHG